RRTGSDRTSEPETPSTRSDQLTSTSHTPGEPQFAVLVVTSAALMTGSASYAAGMDTVVRDPGVLFRLLGGVGKVIGSILPEGF
ncbi:hypothetical protein ACIQWR_41275, partial [Streptomyces sp. NPDC098789]|uniref:hypothetical protein n=1 Tax=Streptomyces sp. NPDC098789 TaxID=3366098 RepID=UPI003819AF26